jgi:hypothetical protein
MVTTGDGQVPHRRASLRASDADREVVVELLREATADGRLGMDEIDDRLTAAYAARTFGDLDRVTWDLVATPADATPGKTVEVAPAHGSSEDPLRLVAVVDDVKRAGRWNVPERIVATAQVGSVKLDFTEAVLAAQVIQIAAWANLGSVTMLVPEGWRVDVDGVSAGIGSVKNKTNPPIAGAPTIKVTGRATVGDVTVRHPRNSRWLPR